MGAGSRLQGSGLDGFRASGLQGFQLHKVQRVIQVLGSTIGRPSPFLGRVHICQGLEANRGVYSSLPQPPLHAHAGLWKANQPLPQPSSSSDLSSSWFGCFIAGVALPASEGEVCVHFCPVVAMVDFEAPVCRATDLTRCRPGVGLREDSPRPLVVLHTGLAAGVVACPVFLLLA